MRSRVPLGVTDPLRAGFTLVEVLVVLVILVGASAVVAPAFMQETPPDDATASAEEVLRVLEAARQASVERGDIVRVTFEPEEGAYWVEAGARGWAEPIRTGVLPLREGFRLETPAGRARFAFGSRGTAAGDALAVAGPAATVAIVLDPSTGAPRAIQRP